LKVKILLNYQLQNEVSYANIILTKQIFNWQPFMNRVYSHSTNYGIVLVFALILRIVKLDFFCKFITYVISQLSLKNFQSFFSVESYHCTNMQIKTRAQGTTLIVLVNHSIVLLRHT